jgi:hypothetical protein
MSCRRRSIRLLLYIYTALFVRHASIDPRSLEAHAHAVLTQASKLVLCRQDVRSSLELDQPSSWQSACEALCEQVLFLFWGMGKHDFFARLIWASEA